MLRVFGDDSGRWKGVANLVETGFELPPGPSFALVEDTVIGTSIAVSPVVG